MGRYIFPKRLLSLSGLHGVISSKTEFFTFNSGLLFYFHILETRASESYFLVVASGIHGSKAGHPSGSDVNVMCFHFTVVKGQKNEKNQGI